jgi:hypothetical protein
VPGGAWLLWVIGTLSNTCAWSRARIPLFLCCLEIALTACQHWPADYTKDLGKAVNTLRRWCRKKDLDAGLPTLGEAKNAVCLVDMVIQRLGEAIDPDLIQLHAVKALSCACGALNNVSLEYVGGSSTSAAACDAVKEQRKLRAFCNANRIRRHFPRPPRLPAE